MTCTLYISFFLLSKLVINCWLLYVSLRKLHAHFRSRQPSDSVHTHHTKMLISFEQIFQFPFSFVSIDILLCRSSPSEVRIQWVRGWRPQTLELSLTSLSFYPDISFHFFYKLSIKMSTVAFISISCCAYFHAQELTYTIRLLLSTIKDG